ncbi:hypothetical protein D3C80_1504980 [compost metagenome]
MGAQEIADRRNWLSRSYLPDRAPHQELLTPLPQPDFQGHQAVGFATEALRLRSVLDRFFRKERAGRASRPLHAACGPIDPLLIA